MRLRRLGIIGTGGIADVALSALAAGLARPLEQVTLLVREASIVRASEMLDRLGDKLALSRTVHSSLDKMLTECPQLVAECASHVAVRDYGADILAAGIDLAIVSIGALADAGLRARLENAAIDGDSQLIVLPGAIGGIDALAAARLSGLQSVTYVGRKPPLAWRGTAAERLIELAALTEPVVFFSGSAALAARDYPFNANVTAALALSGLGFDETRVQLVADPGIARNVHEFSVTSGCGDFSVRLEGRPSLANPKTSLLAGFSVSRELLNRTAAIVV